MLNKPLFVSLICAALSFSLSAKAEEFVALPGDVLQVSVWNEPSLDQEVLVLSDGTISFPLVGSFQVKGLSLTQIQSGLKNSLETTIPSAEVSVRIKAPTGHKVSVLGQVNKPGDVILTSPLRVMQALSQVGGLTAFADEDHIVIIRAKANGEKETIDFPYDEIVDGNDLDKDIDLQPGDVIVVSGDGLF